ncbi:MAG: hypothetical protein IID37_17435, partial [Planctomycetes bacterium]|nr:hypothetical protein [Planctomycetota bacterium]
MKINSVWQTVRNHGRWLFLLVACATLIGVAPSVGGERKFAVMLANSPKEFPENGQPAQGLVSVAEIDRRYFGPILDNGGCYSDVDSFAAFWEEISYGDVTVTGQAFDWLSLPLAIRPPL